MTYQNLGYWIGQSNDTSTGSHPTGWTNGQRWSETASEWNAMYTAAYSARYTEGYNAGYSAGYAQATTDKQPSTLWDGSTSVGGYTPAWNTWGGTSAGLSVPYTGYYALMVEGRLNNTNHNDDGDYIQLRILDNGGVIFTGAQQGKNKQPPGSNHSWHYAQTVIQVTAGHSITLQGFSYSQNSNPSVTLDNVFVRARFMPTPAQPH